MGLGISLIIGFIGAIMTIILMGTLSPCCNDKCGMKDERYILSLHGIPGIFSGLISVIVIVVY